MNEDLRPTAELLPITPDVAKDWLGRNSENRGLRDRKVATYTAEMKSNDWLVTGEGVKFDWNGKLIDGQHRLHAVIASGAQVEMFVFRNLDPQVQKVIDTGAKRSPRDALKFAGFHRYATELAAMARVVIIWDEGGYKNSGDTSAGREVTNTEIVEWAAENPDAVSAIETVVRINNRQAFPVPSKAVLSAVFYTLSRSDPEGVLGLADRMMNMSLEGVGDPLYTLYTRLKAAEKGRETLRPAGLLTFYFRVWNALVEGESLYNLKIGKVSGGAGKDVHIRVPRPKFSSDLTANERNNHA